MTQKCLLLKIKQLIKLYYTIQNKNGNRDTSIFIVSIGLDLYNVINMHRCITYNLFLFNK